MLRKIAILDYTGFFCFTYNKSYKINPYPHLCKVYCILFIGVKLIFRGVTGLAFYRSVADAVDSAAEARFIPSDPTSASLPPRLQRLLEDARQHVDPEVLAAVDLDDPVQVDELRALVDRLQAETAEFDFTYSIDVSELLRT